MEKAAARSCKRKDHCHDNEEEQPAGHCNLRTQIMAQGPQPGENKWKQEDASLGAKGIAGICA